MRTLSRFIFQCVLLLAVFSLLGANVKAERNQTIMIYVTGSDLETNSGAASLDISEMLSAGHDDKKTTVLVMIGGARRWHDFPAGQTAIYEIRSGGSEAVYQGDLLNMGEADTLRFFLDYGYANYRADRYALILWDHGGGPLEGVCYDENFKVSRQMDSLSLPELGDALGRSPFSGGKKLEWIGFDACLMSSVETAAVCAPHARYMIASQEVEPGTGWDYSFLKEIDQAVTGDLAGRMIVDCYYSATSKKSLTNPLITLSCIDLGKLPALTESLDTAFLHFGGNLTENTYSSFVRKRQETSSIGRSDNASSNYDLADLLDLSRVLGGDTVHGRQLQQAIDDCIVYSRSNVEGLNGLSMYFPCYNQYYWESNWSERYRTLSVSQSYLDFLARYSSIWLGEALTDWSDTKEPEMAVQEDITSLSVELTEAQAQNLASASLYVLVDRMDGTYLFSGQNNEFTIDGATLTAADTEKILVFCDKDGNIISGSTWYRVTDGRYTVNAVLSEKDYFSSYMEELPYTYVQINCLPPDENGYLPIVSITPSVNDGELAAGKEELSLADYNWLTCVQVTSIPTRDESGRLLPFNQWDTQGIYGFEYELQNYDHTLQLRLIDRENTGEEYTYLFVLSDTQGNQYATEMTGMNSRVITPLSLGDLQGTQLFSGDGLTAVLAGAEILQGSVYNGLKLSFDLTNTHEATDSEVLLAQIMVNGYTLTEPRLTMNFEIEKDQVSRCEVTIPGYELAKYGITQIESITLDTTAYYTRYKGCQTVTHLVLPEANRWDVSAVSKGENLLSLPDLCSAEDDFGVRFTLKKISGTQSDGNVTLTMLVENNADFGIQLYDYSILVDNLHYDTLGPSTVIPQGGKALVEWDIRDSYGMLDTYADGKRTKPTDRFDKMGTNSFSELLIFNNDALHYEDGVQISAGARLTLPEPFDYAALRGSTLEAPAMAALCRIENAPAVSVYHAEIYGGRLYLDVLIENHTSQPMNTYGDYVISGKSTGGSYYGDSFSFIPAGVTFCSCLAIDLPEGALNAQELHVEMSYWPYDFSYDENGQWLKYPFSFTVPIAAGEQEQVIPVSSIVVAR